MILKNKTNHELKESFKILMKEALKKDCPYPFRSPFKGEKKSAVLCLIGFHHNSEDPHILVIKRAEREGDPHSGQYAFPGGMFEVEKDESLLMTALRETEEEVSLSSHHFEVMGELPSLTTPSLFMIQPYVALLKGFLPDFSLSFQDKEVVFAKWFRLKELKDSHRVEKIKRGEIFFETDVFEIDEHRIWGATGAMIKNLLDRLMLDF